jgi:hypothetical protein
MRWCLRKRAKESASTANSPSINRGSSLRCPGGRSEGTRLVDTEETRADALNCGEALSTVLLECTRAGLATCTLTHITELAESRAVIQDLTGSRAFPQVLIRVGKRRRSRRPRHPRRAAP